jgi:Inosine-uridine preferring nucleoside hydrolase
VAISANLCNHMDRTWRPELIAPRARVISDNDYCGDPDGVVQLAHHLLCLSVDVRLVVGSAVAPHHPAWSETCTEDSVAVARQVAELAGRPEVQIAAGSSLPMPSVTEPALSPAVEAVVAEAMRDDTDLPLFMACGGGLTTIASAWLTEPRIADRLTIAWNGGEAYGLDAANLPPDPRYRETNVNTDMAASHVVFNQSDIPIWQIPQDVFSDVVVSRSEALVRMQPHGPLGAHLYDSIGARVDAWSQGLRMGETYGLGDLPLVLLTALGGAYDPEPGSSRWITRPRPRLLDDGLYEDAGDADLIRVFTHLDVRLLLEDLYAKLALHAAGER